MSGPLAGLRVIDASTVLAGPLAAQLLGDYGADVVKIEHPDRPDSLRTHGPAKDGVGLWWKMLGRNKRTIGLNLADAEAREVFLRLVEGADVLIENFRPGTLERWGLGYDRLSAANPGLILLRVTGFGQTGPYAHRPGFGTLAEAMSGFAAITGEPDGPPTLPPFGLADSIAGITGFGAVLAALYRRDAGADGEGVDGGGAGKQGGDRGGGGRALDGQGDGRRGQVIDLNILAPLVTVLGPQPIAYDQLGLIPARTGNRSTNNAPRNTYRTKDGHWLGVSTSANSIAVRLMRLVGHPEVTDEPWFASGRERARHADLLDRYVGDWIGQRTRDEVLAEFEAAEVAIAPVYTVADLMNDPHVIATQMITGVEDEDLGPVRMQNLLFGLSATPGGIRFTGRGPYADSRQIIVEELGVSEVEFQRLSDRGVIR